MKEHNVDLQLLSQMDQERPSAPYDLKLESLTDTVATFAYKQPISNIPIKRWEIERSEDGFASSPLAREIARFEIPFTLRRRVWGGMKPDTAYAYRVRSRGNNNRPSTWSALVHGHTLGEGGVPSTPKNVRVVASSEHSLRVAWDASVAAAQVREYTVYRDGKVVRRLPGSLLTLEEHGLLANTTYEYVIVARDRDNRQSRPSIPLHAHTQGNELHPTWRLDHWYEVGVIVTHQGHLWTCLQAHRSYDEQWAPGRLGALAARCYGLVWIDYGFRKVVAI
jgi:chitin-binding protein